MISAQVVSQIVTVTHVPRSVQEPMISSQSQEKVPGMGACGCRQQDFMSMLAMASHQESGGMAGPLPLFPSMLENGSFERPPSDLVGFFSSMLASGGGNNQQDPFNFIQSLSPDEHHSFRAAGFMMFSSTPEGGGMESSQKDIQALFHQMVDALFNGGEPSKGTSGQDFLDFPPPDASQEVVDAWDKASTEASPVVQRLAAALFVGLSLQDYGLEGSAPTLDGKDVLGDSISQVGDVNHYWQQVEALMAMMDRAMAKSPEQKEDTEKVRTVLSQFQDVLEESPAYGVF